MHTVQVPLRAVDDVVLNSWVGEDGDPVALISVSHRSGRGGGTVAQHVCDDPECPEGDGSFLLESWDKGLEIVGNRGLLGQGACWSPRTPRATSRSLRFMRLEASRSNANASASSTPVRSMMMPLA